VLEAINNAAKSSGASELTVAEMNILLTPFDIKRLESYANNMLDYHVIMDLLPTIAVLYFERRLGSDVKLSAVQSSILLSLGLQRKAIEDVEVELNLPVSQALALFVKSIRKICRRLQDITKEAVGASIPMPVLQGDAEIAAKPLRTEMEEAAAEVVKQLNDKVEAASQSISSLNLGST